MEYRQFAAPADLARWVECLWILRGALAVGGRCILPDGRVELVFHFGCQPSGQAGSLLTGQSTEAVRIVGSGKMDSFGVRLRPETSMCLDEARPDSAREQAGNERSDGARLQAFVDWLRAELLEAPEPDAAVARSIELIELNHGRGAIEQYIPDALRVRQWQRRFLAATGLSPKAFARIARLQRVVALYQSRQWQRWADLALESGFYDQAHLANEFRAFSGQTPNAFFREGRGMAEFYRDGFFQDRSRALRVEC
jgi:AraC-like DNA-binding protein